MNGIDKPLVANAFSKAASRYDSNASLQRAIGNLLLEQVTDDQPKAGSVLDLGTGTGYALPGLAKHFPGARLTAVDIAPGMLKQAQQHNPNLAVEYIEADATDLPIPDASIELVFSNLMLQWVDDVPAFFAECHRILKPGGRIYLSTFGSATLIELRQSWGAVDKGTHVNQFIDVRELGNMVHAQGFAPAVLDVDRLQIEFDDFMALCRNLKNLGASNHSRERQATLTGKERFAKVASHYEQFRQNGKLPASYEVLNLFAMKPSEAPAGPESQGGEVAHFSLEYMRQKLKER